MDFTQLDQEEKLLLARLEDMARIAAKSGQSRYTSFLNERQQLLAAEAVRRYRLDGFRLWGGYPDAVRRMAGFFPSWQEPADEEFPFVAVAVHLPKGAEPSHRDILGSLMSLGITRESVGDILLAPGRGDVFVIDSVAGLITGELKRIGGFGVRCETGVPGEYVRSENFKAMRGTVPSVRMDVLVGLLTGLAREKSAALIRGESVQRNYQIVHSVSGEFSPGDVITIRGYGKYIVDEIGSPTKKNRLPVLCRKYI